MKAQQFYWNNEEKQIFFGLVFYLTLATRLH
jgi:hypothetical protein